MQFVLLWAFDSHFCALILVGFVELWKSLVGAYEISKRTNQKDNMLEGK